MCVWSAFCVAELGPERLLEEQAEAWGRLWREGCVVVDVDGLDSGIGDDSPPPLSSPSISRVVHCSQYSLLTCLPTVTAPAFPESISCCNYFGLCPTGLSRGNESDDYMVRVVGVDDVYPFCVCLSLSLCALDTRILLFVSAPDETTDSTAVTEKIILLHSIDVDVMGLLLFHFVVPVQCFSTGLCSMM